jgi:hypothetical protein
MIGFYFLVVVLRHLRPKESCRVLSHTVLVAGSTPGLVVEYELLEKSSETKA